MMRTLTLSSLTDVAHELGETLECVLLIAIPLSMPDEEAGKVLDKPAEQCVSSSRANSGASNA